MADGVGSGIAVGQGSSGGVPAINAKSSIITAVSEIGQYSVTDEQQQTPPEEIIAINERMEFMACGIHSVLAIFFASTLLIPICVSIWLDNISVYGSKPLLFDKILVTLMALGIAGGMFSFQIWASKYCKGNITLIMIRNLYYGTMTAILMVGFATTIIFSLLLYYSQPSYYNVFYNIGINKDVLQVFFSYHNIFLYSIFALWGYCAFFVIIMLIVHFNNIARVRKLNELREFINNNK